MSLPTLSSMAQSKRARDLGVSLWGVPGAWNAITADAAIWPRGLGTSSRMAVHMAGIYEQKVTARPQDALQQILQKHNCLAVEKAP